VVAFIGKILAARGGQLLHQAEHATGHSSTYEYRE